MEKINSTKNKWAILAVLTIMPFMVTLDGTIVNVALPDMAKDLHTQMETVQIVVIAYLIAVVATILFFGKLGDLKGKSNLFIIGTLVFTMGSLFAGTTKDLTMLVIARVIQGVGGSAALANNQGIITEVFPSNQRGRALGFVGVAVALGTMLGPALGGIIVSKFTWDYIFLINLPVGIIAFIFALKILPKTKKIPQKIDISGSILLAIGVISFFYALLDGQNKGYDKPYIIILFALAAVFIVLFLLQEKRALHPVIDLSLFKNSLFTISILCVLSQFFAMSGINIIQPFFLEDALKIPPEQTGLILMSVPIAMGISSPIAGAVSDKIGSEKITILGLGIMATGVFLLATLNLNTSIPMMVIFLMIIGFGAGIFSAPNTSLIMSTARKDNLGIVGSINSFTRNFGMVLGISISTAILYSLMGMKEGHVVRGFTQGNASSFIYGMQWVYIFCGSILVLGLLLTIFRSRKAAKATNSTSK